MKKGLYFKLDTENPDHKKIIDFFDHIVKRKKTKVLHDLIVYACWKDVISYDDIIKDDDI